MKLLNAILLFIAIQSATSTFANPTPIPVTIYCDDAYFPYSYRGSKDEALGIYSEILSKAFASMPEYKISIKPMPWARALSSLQKNEVFAVYPPYLRPAERPFIKDYSLPILDETIVVFTRKGATAGKKQWPRDWFGKKIGLFTGTLDIAGPEFSAALKEKKIQVLEAKSNEENLRNLINHKVDAYVNDRNAILHTLKTLKQKKQWPTNAPEIEEAAIVAKESGYVAFSSDDKKYPYKQDFIKKLNLELLKLKKENEIEKVISNYWTHLSDDKN